jgi:hypothetical protein
MKKILIIIYIVAMALSFVLMMSCNTLKQDQKNLVHIVIHNPILLDKWCSSNYKTKDSISTVIKYLPGSVITKEGNTIYVDCDTIHDTLLRKVKITCPVYKVKTDTIISERLSFNDNPSTLSTIEILTKENKLMAEDLLIVTNDKNRLTLKLNSVLIKLWSVIGLAIIILIIKYYVKWRTKLPL